MRDSLLCKLDMLKERGRGATASLGDFDVHCLKSFPGNVGAIFYVNSEVSDGGGIR